jgi:O-antigen ligase
MFMTWPLLFHTFEPQLRASVYNKLPMSSQHRIEIWHFAMEKWQEKPLLGWGVDSSRKIPGGEDDSSLGKGFARLPLHPHNLPINVLLEEGLIGFGFFGIALFLFVRRILPVNPMYPSALLAARAATLVSYLTVGMSGFGMWQGWWEATGLAAFLIVLLVD